MLLTVDMSTVECVLCFFVGLPVLLNMNNKKLQEKQFLSDCRLQDQANSN